MHIQSFNHNILMNCLATPPLPQQQHNGVCQRSSTITIKNLLLLFVLQKLSLPLTSLSFCSLIKTFPLILLSFQALQLEITVSVIN